MPWISDGSDRSPRLRVDLSLGTLSDLPASCRGPRMDDPRLFDRVREAGFEGVQASPEAAERVHGAGLALTLSGRVDALGDAERHVEDASLCRADAVTLHVGTGFENDDEADALFDSIVVASRASGVPLFVETHRATLTQDPHRTLGIAARHPDLRFNADLSHWYAGAEMVYGDWERKLRLLDPIFARSGFLHGRIASPGCIQAACVVEGDVPAYMSHFRELWQLVFAGFLTNARNGDVVVFAPELLPPRIGYAREFGGIEETDRWEQAILLGEFARACFRSALDGK